MHILPHMHRGVVIITFEFGSKDFITRLRKSEKPRYNNKSFIAIEY